MTKKQMINVIKESGVVVNFSESHFNHRSKAYTERFFGYACDYMHRNHKNDIDTETEYKISEIES